MCSFSPSHSRSGTFTGIERKRHQSKTTSGDAFVMLDIVSINKNMNGARKDQGKPQICDRQTLQAITCA